MRVKGGWHVQKNLWGGLTFAEFVKGGPLFARCLGPRGRATDEGPGDRREVPIEFIELPKCKKTFRLSPAFFQSSS